MQFIAYHLYLHTTFKKRNLTFLCFSIQSVASIGNTLNSVHLAVETIQKTVDEHKITIESLQSDMVRKSVNAADRQHVLTHPFLCQLSTDLNRTNYASVGISNK